VKNGPRTLFSVAPPITGLFNESTRAETPRTSDSRMFSWRNGVHFCPVRVKNSIAAIHSSVVRLGIVVESVENWRLNRL
jgi:hypothetical protein